MTVSAVHLRLGAGLLALAVVGVWLGASHTTTSAASLRAKIERSRAELRQSQANARDVRTMADTLHEARLFATTSTKPVAPSDETSTLMHDISSFLGALRVTKHELRQDRSRVEDGVRIVPLVLTMEATYPDVLAVLDRVHSLDRLLRVPRLTIDPPRGSAPGAPVLIVEIVIEALSTETPAAPVMVNATEGDAR